MSGLGILCKVVILQIIVVAVVIYVLKRFLDEDLILMAFEQTDGLQPSAELKKTGQIVVITAGKLAAAWQSKFSLVLKKKFPNADVEFLENSDLKGGLVIEISGEVLDFSLATRLRHLFCNYDEKDSGHHSSLQ